MKRDEYAKLVANDMLQFVNNLGADETTFAKTIAIGHKTLQQSFMRLMIRTFEEMAKVVPDDRNAATVELAKAIVELAKNHPLPFI